jgi:hypothetical protein
MPAEKLRNGEADLLRSSIRRWKLGFRVGAVGLVVTLVLWPGLVAMRGLSPVGSLVVITPSLLLGGYLAFRIAQLFRLGQKIREDIEDGVLKSEEGICVGHGRSLTVYKAESLAALAGEPQTVELRWIFTSLVPENAIPLGSRAKVWYLKGSKVLVRAERERENA